MKMSRSRLIRGCVFSIMFFSVFSFPIEVGGSNISTKILPLFFLGAGILLGWTNRVLQDNYFPVVLLFLLSTSIGSLFEINSLIYSMNFILLFSFTVILSRVNGIRYGSEYYFWILDGFLLTSIVGVLFSILQYFNYALTDMFWFLKDTPYYESKGQFSSMYTNPNIFGFVSALSITALQITFFYNRMKFSTFILSMIILLIGVYLSGSRMSVALSLVSIVLFNLYVWLHKDWFLIFAIVMIAAVTFLFEMIATIVDLNFRGVIWTASLNIIKDNVFFGVGLGNLQYLIQDYSSMIKWVQSANNFFIGWLAEAGLISFILFLFLFLKFTRIKVFAKEGFSFFLILLLVSQYSEYFIIYVSIYTFLLISMLSMVSMRHEKNGM